ncbi:MAG: tRNA uridine-5-carboxymethylaminomethyl(34) synthesis enzyme MnmG, partial [Rhizobiaceae bacterium]
VYLDKQSADASSLRKEESRLIPPNANFDHVSGLSNELRQKLKSRRPASIAEAQRIDGMTPAALALVIMEIRRIEAADRGAA